MRILKPFLFIYISFILCVVCPNCIHAETRENLLGMQVIKNEGNYTITKGNGYTKFYFSVLNTQNQFKWSDFESRYLYSKLPKNYRDLYLKWYDISNEYLNGGSFVNTLTLDKETEKYYVTNQILLDNTVDESVLLDLYSIFLYENPQFYFYSGAILVGHNSMWLCIYDEFNTSSIIYAKSDLVKQELQKYIDVINNDSAEKTEYYISNRLKNLICANVSYSKTGFNIVVSTGDDNGLFTQSIYSALIKKDTVCAGYTKLYSALMSYFNMDAVSISSDNHVWNKVRMGDDWFVVDLTWLDTAPSYDYFLQSDAEINELDSKLNVKHKNMNKVLLNIEPIASSTFEDKGLLPETKPILDNSNNILYCVNDADIYISMDGANFELYDKTEIKPSTYIVAYALGSNTDKSCLTMLNCKQLSNKETPVTTEVTNKSKVKAPNCKVTKKVSKSKAFILTATKKNCSGYEVRYSTRSNFVNYKTKSSTTNTVKVTKLKGNTVYYVQMRTLVKEKGNRVNGKWSKTVKIRTK